MGGHSVAIWLVFKRFRRLVMLPLASGEGVVGPVEEVFFLDRGKLVVDQLAHRLRVLNLITWVFLNRAGG